jgi:hypothetical protein
MAIIKVPKTPGKAFDRNRRPSDLLLKQIEHLEWAALPAAHRKPGHLPTRKVKTEAQAAERVAQLTNMVLAAHDAPVPAVPGPRAPVVLPPLPKAGPRAGTRSAVKRAAKAKAARRAKRKTSLANAARRASGRGRK